jgi:hypothetical protein
MRSAFGKEWESRAPIRLVDLAYHGIVEAEGQQVVVLCSILSHPLNIGYEPNDYAPLPLVSVDGTKIRCLADVVRAIAASPGPFTKVSADYTWIFEVMTYSFAV